MKGNNMKKEEFEQVIDICIDIFSDTGLVNFAKLLKRVRDTDASQESIDDLLAEENKWLNFEGEKKRRMVAFGDDSQFLAMRFHIVNAYRTWRANKAALIINEMPEEVNMKDNPLKNIVLLYDDDRLRDRDYARLRMILG
jgi:hypothetical protein